jgi:hypothetical protein
MHRSSDLDSTGQAHLPDNAAAILPMVTDVFIQCKKVRSLAAVDCSIGYESERITERESSGEQSSSHCCCYSPKKALASVLRSSVAILLAKLVGK